MICGKLASVRETDPPGARWPLSAPRASSPDGPPVGHPTAAGWAGKKLGFWKSGLVTQASADQAWWTAETAESWRVISRKPGGRRPVGSRSKGAPELRLR